MTGDASVWLRLSRDSTLTGVAGRAALDCRSQTAQAGLGGAGGGCTSCPAASAKNLAKRLDCQGNKELLQSLLLLLDNMSLIPIFFVFRIDISWKIREDLGK